MAAEAPKGTARRDQLLSLELKAQAKWEKANAFEVDAPEGAWDAGKFLATFPYPYMNGLLHIGHGFSLTKAEFAVAFNRLQGKKALFPFAFHCTGMPIQAAAVKLKNEYEKYGCPVPNFPPSPPEVVELNAEEGTITIGWKLPTSTGGKTLTACRVLLRTGPVDAAFEEIGVLPAAEAEKGGQCSWTATGLTVGSNYSFKVVTVVDGLDGVPSKTLEKSADGKHALALLAPKKDEGKKGGGGGAGGKKGAKSKVVAKTGGMMTQWDILRAMGLGIDEIVPFTDPTYWLRYFPPLGKKDLKRFGCGIDWRRTFITTDYNAYYDQFVRWQFQKLRAAELIAFGKRPSIFSEADGQPCMDHDRDKGEGVGNQEYTAIKLRVLEPFPAPLAPLAGKEVYCLAGTLRPETMCGQTNCWILPEGEYAAFDGGGNKVYVCAERAARNMGFQDLLPQWGSPTPLLKVKGVQLIGTALKAPATSYEKIYMLPLTTISMGKGTAIVTSVPSDSPDDYAAFMDLKNPKKREFYNVQAEWVDPFEPLSIIETPDLGTLSAKFMCEKLKVQSQKDVEKLKEAHDIVYNSGFYKGVMIAGAFKGLQVQEAKPKMKQKMIDDGEAFTYYEPDGVATPRSSPDVECVVALVDQWYLKYGADEWKAKVASHLEKMECYNPAVTKAFQDALGWLSGWACSRSFGLGTRMPWDEKFLIESLSDSTIYMAFYSIAHLLQGGEMFGKEVGPSGVKPEQCTAAFFDYIFYDKPYDAALGVPQATMDAMRREFRFWYPMDMRVSGKDLIPNHLTMSLYNHTAVWAEQPEMWPLSIYCNGHVQVDAEKMSKSKGNFITMDGAIQTWGADATRFTCADAGDGVENANYDRVIADRTILNLTTELDWLRSVLAGSNKDFALRAAGAPGVWLDEWFANEMVRIVKLAEEKYKAMRFKEALKVGFYNMQEARNRYRTGTAQAGLKKELLQQWAEWQALMMAPITPHWSEELWEVLDKPGCIVTARWPRPATAENAALTAAGTYLFDVAHSLAATLSNRDKKKPAKGAAPQPTEKPNQINLYVAYSFPRWKEIVLEMLRSHWDPAAGEVDKAVLQLVTKNEELNAFNKGKQVPQFAAMMREEAKANGLAALSLTMPFDEGQVLRDNTALLCSAVGVAAIHVWTTGNDELPQPELLASAAPGKPQPHFYFDNTIQPSPPVVPPPSAAGAKLTPFEYVEMHNLAPLLNTAINEVSRAQPADPKAWLSEWLAKQK